MSAAARQDPHSRPRVLLVEDDRAIREHLAEAFNDEFVVDAAETGAHALNLLLRARPDGVVTYVSKPGLGGMELLKALRGTPSTRLIPVLLTSRSASEDVRIEG